MMDSEFPQATVLGSEVRTLHSTAVSDDYEISVWLPPSYATSSKRYPTLYVLDAPFAFGVAAPVVLGQNWDGLVPEMMVVGIGKNISRDDEWWPIRNRDYAPVVLPNSPGSGHAATFLHFIGSELVPFIDANYRTNPDDRTLWGHSLGGAFVLFTWFNKPGLFYRHIATSPALVLDGETLIDYKAGLPPKGSSTRAQLFVSVGSLDNEFGPHIKAFITAMENKDHAGPEFKTVLLEGFGHISAAQPGFIHGLRALFSS